MEAILEGFISFLRVIIFQIILELFLYNLGRFVLYGFSFGRYPRGSKSEDHRGRITFFGLVIFFSVVFAIAYLT